MDATPQTANNSQRSLGWAKLLIVLVPLLFLIGYYTYSSVSGATFFGVTLRSNVDLENGLVGHWTFDGGDMLSTSTARDSSGNSNNASLENGAKPAVGKIGQGMNFDGVDDFISVPADASLDITSSLTLSTWAKLGRIPDNGERLGLFLKNAPSNYYYRLDIFNNGIDLVLAFTPGGGGANSYSSGLQLEVGTWYHITLTFDVDTDVVTIYVNGVEVGSGSDDVIGGYASGSGTLQLGSWDGEQFFAGQLDDMRVYNRALSAKEVEVLYNLGEGSKMNTTPEAEATGPLQDGLVGHWSFDGGDMDWASATAEATDRSGNNNNGDVTNFTNSQVAIGKVGQALTFDKVDDYINAGSSSSLDDLGPLTVSMWIKPRSFGEGDALGKIIGKDASAATPGAWQLSLLNGTSCSGGGTPTQTASIFFGKVGSSGTSRSLRCSADNSITLNEWQYVTATWDGTGEGNNAPGIRLYKNGIEMSYTTTNSGSANSAGSDAALDLYIGNRLTNDRTFDGHIDDVRLYNRVLSADEVAQLYSFGSGSTIKICRETSVQDADSNTYNTLAIGSQCWLDRNMDVGTRIAAASNQTDNSTIEKYCYSNTDANCTTNHPDKPDGGLYQWNEAMQYSTTEGARGICPIGFHIPADDEWHTLEKFLTDGGASCISTRTSYGCSPAGIKLYTGGSSLFSGNSAGYVDSGLSDYRDSAGVWWSSSPSGGDARTRVVYPGVPRVSRGVGIQSRGYSVRCIQD